MKRFGEIFRYELGYRLRSPLTWIYFALIWGGTIFIVHVSSTEGNRVINAPLHHSEIVTMLGFFLMVVTVGIFGDAATRDTDTGMQSLFSTAPISKLDYLGGRFVASFLVNAVLLAGMPLMVALTMAFPWLSHFNWAPFRVMSFVQPYVLLTLPNLLISAAVIYSIAALTKNSLATYVGALGLGILYLIIVNQGLGNETVESLIDPFALTSMQRLTAYWTPSEKTSRLIGFPGIIVLNRVLWLSLATGLLAFLYARFSFAAAGLRGGRRSLRAPGETDEPVRHAIASVPQSRRRFGARTRFAQLAAVTRHSMADIMRNRVFLVIVVGMLALVLMFGWEVGAIVFDTSTWPVTHLIAGTALSVPVTIVFTVLTSIVAGELVWKERDVGAGDIAAAAPIPDWIPFVGRLIALVLLLSLLQLVLMAAGVAIQALQGYYRFEPLLYLKILFGLNLLDYVIWAAFAMAVHVVVNHKNLGHAVVIATWAFTLMAPGFFRIRHNLLLFNGDPGWIYSDMNGFGPFLGPFLWFKAYWGAWALLLVVIATIFWVRSTEGGLRARMRLARLRMNGAAGRAGAVAALLVISTGGFVFYNTNVLHAFRSVDDGRARAVEYETLYKRFEDAPTPTVVANTMRVEIYPERPALDITGSFALVNQTAERIDSVHLAMNDAVTLRSLAFDGGARLVLDDSVHEHRIYRLNRPMEPGDTTRMSFDVAFETNGFSNWRMPTDVVRNGAYFDRDWLPMFGYRASREISNDRVRRELGLPPKRAWPSPYDTTAAMREALLDDGASYVHMDVTIGTDERQVAVTPGKLVREWRDGGRRYFRYVTDEPVTHGVPVFSAEYAVLEDEWHGLPLKIYYHPTHTFNLDRIANAMKASLEYNSANFGPYAYGEMRVVEFPRYASFARAHPHTIAFGEGSAFITRIEKDSPVDRTFFVVSHEAAHQWWGNVLRGARMQGAGLVSETLASYSALMALEKTYGADMAWDFVGYEQDRYLRGRGGQNSRESPMSEVLDQGFLYYSKGAVVMYTLRDMIGEAAVNVALRRFYERFANQGAPYATSRDMIAELRSVTPDSLQYLVTDLFETITLWSVKTDSVSRRQLPDSSWEVTLTVTAKKFRADSIGKETEVPMNDLVEIGVFGPRQDDERGEALYLERHRVRNGTQTITVRVPHAPGKEPVLAGADPDHKLIDRNESGRLKNLAVP